MTKDHFSNLDGLDELLSTPVDTTREVKEIPISLFTERCPSCRGSGQFVSWGGRVLGPCFKCKGKGQSTFKTSPEARKDARDRAAAKKANTAQTRWEAFAEAHPDVAAWMLKSEGTFDFAANMRDAVMQWGSLTEKQMAACVKCVEASKARQEARQKAEAAAPAVSVEAIVETLRTARLSLKRPKLRMLHADQTFEAGMDDEGVIFLSVTDPKVCVAVIKDGKAFKTRKATQAEFELALEAVQNPKAAGDAFGRKFGHCCCCGRELTAEGSVEAGIGPICATKWGF